ncbi:hypothetical protein R3P38DRAFT_1844540 [Favolaschia claudopus]|uniref:T6SS Phospholipase effector Tle1-like catalytic domain-containing protein n=1 Tax=Favolaschia claudopus TaxID=2862362 RepID=A0AAW0A3U5_9AGAR
MSHPADMNFVPRKESNHVQEPTLVDSPVGSTFRDVSECDVPVAEMPLLPPPTRHRSRTLVLCFDGTGDQFDMDNSNIVQFFSLLYKADRSRQMVYYQAGIGTYTTPQIATPFVSKISKALDEAIAWNLHAHVMGGYEFLMQNYKHGDRICIFGFSRGAYTARSLAGMIHKVGLLPACNHQQVPFAYKMYITDDDNGWKQSNAFKQTFSIDVDIEFVGVWDTVNSVGLVPKGLPFSRSNTMVRTFRHAISLDEHRAKFKPNLWTKTSEQDMLGLSETKRMRPYSHYSLSREHGRDKKEKEGKDEKHHERKPSHQALEREYSECLAADTNVEEVWFSGCHCDVGGGSVSNDTPHNLARIPLRWMVRECFKTESGIMFDTDGLRKLGLDPTALYPKVKTRPPALPIGSERIQAIPKPTKKKPATSEPLSRLTEHPAIPTDDDSQLPMSEEEHELHDALSPIYDQLSLKWFWWILEVVPLRQRHRRSEKTWQKLHFGVNMGKGRCIPKQDSVEGVKVHRSVRTRLEAEMEGGGKYKPKAKFDPKKVVWVD